MSGKGDIYVDIDTEIDKCIITITYYHLDQELAMSVRLNRIQLLGLISKLGEAEYKLR